MKTPSISSSQILTHITTNLPIVIFKWKNEESWPVAYVSENVKEMLGYSVEEFTTGEIKYIDIINNKDLRVVAREVLEASNDRSKSFLIHEPYRLIRKDGKEIWVEDRTYLERDENGDVLNYQGIILDVSDKINVEKALEKSRRQYQDLFEKSADAILIINDNNFVDCNQATVEMLRYKSKEELLETHPSELSPPFQPDGQPSFEKADEMMKLAYKNGTHRFEWEHKRADGEVFPVEVLLTHIRDEQDSRILHTTWRDISDRKTAEQALRESVTKFREFSNLLPQIVYEMDLEGNFTYLNDFCFKMTGYSRSVFEEGINVFSLIHHEDIELLKNNFESLINTGESPFDVYRIRKNDGSYIPVHVYSSRVYKNEKLVGFRGIVIDVSEQKEAEKRLKESEERYKLLVENQTDLVVKVDLDGKFEFVSKSYCELFGKTTDELIGKTFLPLVHEEDQEETSKAMEALFTRPYKCYLEQRAMTKDGWRWLAWIDTAILDENENVTSIIGVGRDIHNQKMAEFALQDSEERYRILSSVTIEGIFIHDNGLMYDANESFLRMIGYSREEIIGNNIIPMCVTEKYIPLVIENVKKHQDKPYEIIARKKDGTLFPVELESRNIELKDGDYRVTAVRDITDRKKAEKALRNSEAKFRSVLENTKDMAYQLDIKTQKYDYVNPSSVMVFGFTSDELMAMEFSEMGSRFHPDDREMVITIFKEIVFKKNVKDKKVLRYLEYRWKRKDGVYRWFNDNRTVTFDNDGNPDKMVGSVRDINDQKEAQIALEQSEQRYRNFVSNASEGIYRVDFIKPISLDQDDKALLKQIEENAVISDVNEALAEMYDLSKEDMVGRKAIEVAPDYPERVLLALKSDNYQVKQKETTDLNANGEKVYLSESYSAIVEENHLVRIWGMQRNITLRKKAEDDLRKNEQQLRNIFNNSTNLFYSHTPDHKITYLSPQSIEIFGYPPEEALVKWTELVSDNPINEIGFQTTQKAIETGKAQPYYELELVHKSGKKVWVEVREAPVVENGKTVAIVGALTDITDRHNAEIEREKLQEQLAQAQKMESVGRLAGGVAHDFNNMLEVIIGNVELAMMDVDKDDPLHRDLEEIEKAAQRSADLTRQLLAFARKQTVSPRILNINDVVQGMLKMLGRLIGEDIELAWIPGKSIWNINIDPAQIDQILANLCVNARDAIKDVGKITIETQNITIEKEYCETHREFSPGQFIMLAVSDDGCGMADEVKENLFEPFYTTKSIHEGTGLGLATVFGIIKQNNGFINVYSEIDEGTTFKIYLPRDIGKSESLVDKEINQSAIRGKETILLVEDEKSILQLGERMIASLGYNILTANTPGRAIEICKESKETIHLLITDVVMPEMNGRDLAKNILSYHPNMKRLFMSGYTANVIAHHGVLDEGVNFMQKPFRLNELAANIRRALDED